MSRHHALLLVAPVAVLTAGCSLLTSFDDGQLTESTFDRCRDHVDNDGDGLVDCDDPGCAGFSFCTELTAAACRDGKDNDADGLVDCADPGCAALAGVCAEQTPAACSDGVDNDGDGLVDCADPDCAKLAGCQETTAADCRDGKDNDGDGLVDCADFGCQSTSSCCTRPASAFAGDDFSFASLCSIHACTAQEPTCCAAGYETCNAFDPQRWVAWGLPRARQLNNAFVANEPCGCEASGIVSVESVHLAAGLKVEFDLELPAGLTGSICGGLTTSTTFSDVAQQCSGVPQPGLLLGLCLEARAGEPRRVVAIVDGQRAAEQLLVDAAPLPAALRVAGDGVELTAGALRHLEGAVDPTLATALVLVQGQGTGGRLSHLVVVDAASGPRCAAPATWYRHLARGQPVAPAQGVLTSLAQPTVVQRAAGGYLLLLVGKTTPAGRSGLYAADGDGIELRLSAAPVIPADAGDARFGTRQAAPALLRWGGIYHLWYSREDDIGGSTQRTIAHATSVDGATWQPRPGPAGEPSVLQPAPAPAWDSLSVAAPSVIEAPGGGLLMYYTGTALELSPRPAIGVARSADGVSWKRLQAGAVLAPIPGSAELGLEDPAAAYDPASKVFLLWYTRRAFGEDVAVHHAASSNGLAWTRYPQGAVFGPGPLGTFDERGVESPTVILGGDRIRLWYTGVNAKGTRQIGYAENRGSR